MSPLMTETCQECGSQLTAAGHCVNVNCTVAHRQATRQAAGDTRKASVPQPAAFTSSGRVD